MFEIEQMDKQFDYSLVDDKTADFLKVREYTINGIAEDARVKIGRELKKAQDMLANHSGGIFERWYTSGGISKDDAYYYMELVELSTAVDNRKMDNFLKQNKSLQRETLRKNTPNELKEQVLNGDINSHKEFQELKKQLKQRDEEKAEMQSQLQLARKSEQTAIKQLEDEQDKAPETKTEYKEVIPDNVKKKLEQIENNKKLLEVTEKENREIRKKLREQQEKLQKQQETSSKEDYWDALTDDQIISRQRVYAETNVLEIKEHTDEFLNKVSVNTFRDAAIAKSSQRTKNMIYESTEEVIAWAKSIQQKLNSNSFAEDASYREDV